MARERISTLFALAESEGTHGHLELAHRYVTLARRVGTRYNVRLLPEYRELYCRGCSTFWLEGRTVRTRLRSGRRVRTCLTCGRERRTLLRRTPNAGRASLEGSEAVEARKAGAFVDEGDGDELGPVPDNGPEEE